MALHYVRCIGAPLFRFAKTVDLHQKSKFQGKGYLVSPHLNFQLISYANDELEKCKALSHSQVKTDQKR